MKAQFSFGVLVFMGAACLGPGFASAAGFADPMDTPAIAVVKPAEQPLIALSSANGHLVAVGSRGVGVVSNAAVTHWTQASMPVQSDLDAVQFIDARAGWACGQDGVILHSVDGGKTWTKQFDGIQARTVFEAHYEKQISSGNKNAASFLQEIQLNFDQGPTLPWLSIWFTNDHTGFVVGSFGDIARTDNGGRSWTPWLEHIQNPNFYDLNAIKNVGGILYIVGEQGMVYAYDDATQMFVARPTSYAGSLFGLTGTQKSVIVFGMRGTVYRSTDQGKTWVQSINPSTSSIMAGTTLADGRVILVNVDGDVLTSRDDGKSFVVSGDENSPLTDVVQAGPDQLLIAGLSGVHKFND